LVKQQQASEVAQPLRRDRARRRILEAAGEVFAERGYQKATIREICHMAAVNVAAVNYYFGDKQRLYIEAVKHARALIEQRMPLPEWTLQTPAEDKLQQFISTFLGRLLSPETAAWQTRLLTREIIEPTRACEEMAQESFRPFFGVLLQVLRELLPPATPDYRLHQLGISIVAQCVFYRAQGRIIEMMIDQDERQRFYSVPQLAAHIARFSLDGTRGAANVDDVVAGRPGSAAAKANGSAN
jgi:AcrR family transcriptional regulator